MNLFYLLLFEQGVFIVYCVFLQTKICADIQRCTSRVKPKKARGSDAVSICQFDFNSGAAEASADNS